MSDTKLVLVTGGSSGIGFAIAKKFIENGSRVVITGRNKEKLEEACKILGEQCFCYPFDMDDIDKTGEFVQSIFTRFGKIDVLVNNAGINQKKDMISVSNEDFQHIIHTNQTALFVLTREVVKVMQNQSVKGNIVHISSMAAHYGIPKVVAYTASKAALEGMTRAMAVELAHSGIRVNCVAPGFIKTPMSTKALDSDPQRKDKVLSRTPMGILGEPSDVADAVFFLTSDEASFITGEILKVDGGNSIGF